MRIQPKAIQFGKSNRLIWIVDVNGYWGPGGSKLLGITDKDYINIIRKHGAIVLDGCFCFNNENDAAEAAEEFKILSNLLGGCKDDWI